MRNLKHILEGILDDSDINDNELISIGIIRALEEDNKLFEKIKPANDPNKPTKFTADDFEINRETLILKPFASNRPGGDRRKYMRTLVFGPNIAKLLHDGNIKQFDTSYVHLMLVVDSELDCSGIKLLPDEFKNITVFGASGKKVTIKNLNCKCVTLEIGDDSIINFKSCNIDVRYDMNYGHNSEITSNNSINASEVNYRFDRNTLNDKLVKKLIRWDYLELEGKNLKFPTNPKLSSDILKEFPIKWDSNSVIQIRKHWFADIQCNVNEIAIVSDKKIFMSSRFALDPDEGELKIMKIPGSNFYCGFIIVPDEYEEDI